MPRRKPKSATEVLLKNVRKKNKGKSKTNRKTKKTSGRTNAIIDEAKNKGWDSLPDQLPYGFKHEVRAKYTDGTGKSHVLIPPKSLVEAVKTYSRKNMKYKKGKNRGNPKEVTRFRALVNYKNFIEWWKTHGPSWMAARKLSHKSSYASTPSNSPEIGSYNGKNMVNKRKRSATGKGTGKATGKRKRKRSVHYSFSDYIPTDPMVRRRVYAFRHQES